MEVCPLCVSAEKTSGGDRVAQARYRSAFAFASLVGHPLAAINLPNGQHLGGGVTILVEVDLPGCAVEADLAHRIDRCRASGLASLALASEVFSALMIALAAS